MLFIEWFVPVLWIFRMVTVVLMVRETTMFHKVEFAAMEFVPFLAGFGLTRDRACQR